jgi:hypothetical protein
MNPAISDMRIACISRTLDQVLFNLLYPMLMHDTFIQAILTVAIFRKLFNTHKRRAEFTLSVNQVRRVTISRDNRDSEIRAYRYAPR